MKRKLMCSTVIRLHPTGIEPSVLAGSYWLMNRKETGWSSHGFPYPTLDALLAEWEVSLGKNGTDEFGAFIEANPVNSEGIKVGQMIDSKRGTKQLQIVGEFEKRTSAFEPRMLDFNGHRKAPFQFRETPKL